MKQQVAALYTGSNISTILSLEFKNGNYLPSFCRFSQINVFIRKYNILREKRESGCGLRQRINPDKPNKYSGAVINDLSWIAFQIVATKVGTVYFFFALK